MEQKKRSSRQTRFNVAYLHKNISVNDKDIGLNVESVKKMFKKDCATV